MLAAPTASKRGYGLRDRDLIFNEPATRGYVLRVKDMPDDERPRERLLQAGPGSLSVAELVSVIWGVGSRKEDVLAMAQRTLKEYGEKTISHELDPRRIAEAANIPLTKACQVVASFELGRRYYASQAGRPAQVRNAKQAYQYMKSIGSSQKEQLRGLYLNSQYQVVHDEVISIGSLTSNIVHPREVFQPAIERGAVAIILAHNHPSGRVEATNADIQITEQLVTAGDILGIELLDHLVITATRYISVMDCLPK
jgi:DNA repair protein RadC